MIERLLFLSAGSRWRIAWSFKTAHSVTGKIIEYDGKKLTLKPTSPAISRRSEGCEKPFSSDDRSNWNLRTA